jgi:hypothetical protein
MLVRNLISLSVNSEASARTAASPLPSENPKSVQLIFYQRPASHAKPIQKVDAISVLTKYLPALIPLMMI